MFSQPCCLAAGYLPELSLALNLATYLKPSLLLFLITSRFAIGDEFIVGCYDSSILHLLKLFLFG